MSGRQLDAFGRSIATPISTSNADPPAPEGPALADPATRVALRRYRLRGRLFMLVGVALFIVFVVMVTKQSRHAKWLLEHGARTPGVIENVSRNLQGSGAMAVDYTADGVARRSIISLTETSRRYAPEETVVVIYDPHHPTDIRTLAEENLPNATVPPLVFALVVSMILLVGGLVTFIRARRFRGLLRSPWRAYHARYLNSVRRGRLRPLNPGVQLVSLAGTSDQSALLQIRSTWRWRTDRLRRQDGRTLWVSGDPTGRVVLGVPQTRELFFAAPPRRAVTGFYSAAASEPTTRDPEQAKKALRRLRRIVVAQWAIATPMILLQTRASNLGFALVALGVVLAISAQAYLYRVERKRQAQSLRSSPPVG